MEDTLPKVAYIGRHRYAGGWKLQLLGLGAYREITHVFAEVEIPDQDETTLSLAEEFFDAIVDSKGMTMKSRRRNDE